MKTRTLKVRAILCRILPKDFKQQFHLCDDQPPRISDFYKDFLEEKSLLDRVRYFDESKVQEVLDFCENLFVEEEKRQSLIENKAAILSGFAGTISAGVLTLTVIFTDTESFGRASTFLKITSVFFFGLALFGLLMCIFFSLRIFGVWTYSHPPVTDIFDLEERSILAVKKKRAINYFQSYVRNQAVNDRKVDNYKFALTLFRASMISMLILLIMIGCLGILYSPEGPNAVSATPPSNPPCSTAMPVTTETMTPTATPFSAQIATPLNTALPAIPAKSLTPVTVP